MIGWRHVDPANWHPFIPANRGGFAYGVPGIFRAASVLFFAYLGFETVSTAALEARNPRRDLPIGILSALVICTILYIIVARVMTGLVPYTALNVPDPVAVAVDAVGWPAMGILIKVGALMGLSSVLLVNTYGQSRICFAMATDGLLPRFFSAMHPRFQTPWKGTLFVAAVSARIESLGTPTNFATSAMTLLCAMSLPPPMRAPPVTTSVAPGVLRASVAAASVRCRLDVLSTSKSCASAASRRMPPDSSTIVVGVGAAHASARGARDSCITTSAFDPTGVDSTRQTISIAIPIRTTMRGNRARPSHSTSASASPKPSGERNTSTKSIARIRVVATG